MIADNSYHNCIHSMITLNVAVASKVRRLNVGGLNGRLAYLLDLMKLAFKDNTTPLRLLSGDGKKSHNPASSATIPPQELWKLQILPQSRFLLGAGLWQDL
jgi:hypothetical protein